MEIKMSYNLSEEDLRDMNCRPSGFRLFPVLRQIENLGLEKLLDKLKGKKVLDIGCGDKPKLVNYLRSLRIEADGIDSEIEVIFPFLMPQIVNSSNRIPKPNEYYDLVTAHSVSPLRIGFTSLRYQENFDFSVEVAQEEGVAIIHEAMRVLKREGRFVVWPSLDLIEEAAASLLDYEIKHENLPEEINRVRREEFGKHQVPPCLERRTVFSYKR
jgi:SAM-dependent methyltransferase